MDASLQPLHEEVEMTDYALFFESGGPILGDGYIASVRVYGRLLAVQDDGGQFELSGVNPGSLLSLGTTLNEAYQELVESLRRVLIDIASDVSGFEAFSHQARDFFNTTDPQAETRWLAARTRARRGELPGNLGLRIERNDPELGIDVERVETPSPSANAPAQDLLPSALAA